MNYQDGSPVQFGDIITIGTVDNKLITVQDDGETLYLHDFISKEKHAFIFCGSKKSQSSDSKEFYLTFKYNRGFIYFHDGVFKSGVPWPERTAFDSDKLKTALHVPLEQELIVTKIADAE